MKGSVSVTDKGWGRAKREAASLKGRAVRVGLRAGGASGEVIQYAAYNEFGTKTVPARPFMRTAADTGRDKAGALMGQLARAVVGGRISGEQALDRVGLWFVDFVQQTIQNAASWAKPLSPRTIAAKGSSKPLIDTRVMLRSVDYEKE